ncbi:MAG: thioredoxin family protein [Flavobacteriaceae bacterium]|nr:thioredoxin family protein [Flavobacteriaceae bacterium]
MSLTPSNMFPLHKKAPSFNLMDVTQKKKFDLNDLKGEKGTLIVFICNHCPFVIHLLEHLTKFSDRIKSKGISTVAISSNNIKNYPLDAPDKMYELSKKYNFSFPYLYDPSQKVAKAYDAACTPDFYLFDEKIELVYRGRYDSSRPKSNIPISGEDLENAALNLLNKKPISEKQFPSMGCNIKWK